MAHFFPSMYGNDSKATIRMSRRLVVVFTRAISNPAAARARTTSFPVSLRRRLITPRGPSVHRLNRGSPNYGIELQGTLQQPPGFGSSIRPESLLANDSREIRQQYQHSTLRLTFDNHAELSRYTQNLPCAFCRNCQKHHPQFSPKGIHSDCGCSPSGCLCANRRITMLFVSTPGSAKYDLRYYTKRLPFVRFHHRLLALPADLLALRKQLVCGIVFVDVADVVHRLPADIF